MQRSQEGGTPERVVYLNHKSDQIPQYHYSVLDFVIVGISGNNLS